MPNLVIDGNDFHTFTADDLRKGKFAGAIAKATEGDFYHSDTYYPQRLAAHQVKIPFGGYLYLHPDSAGNEAEYFVKFARPRKGDLGPFVDAETLDKSNLSHYALRVFNCCHELKKYGLNPVWYSPIEWAIQAVEFVPALKQFPVWEPQYPAHYSRWSRFMYTKRIKLRHGITVVMWQFTDAYRIGAKTFDCSIAFTPMRKMMI